MRQKPNESSEQFANRCWMWLSLGAFTSLALALISLNYFSPAYYLIFGTLTVLLALSDGCYRISIRWERHFDRQAKREAEEAEFKKNPAKEKLIKTLRGWD